MRLYIGLSHRLEGFTIFKSPRQVSRLGSNFLKSRGASRTRQRPVNSEKYCELKYVDNVAGQGGSIERWLSKLSCFSKLQRRPENLSTTCHLEKVVRELTYVDKLTGEGWSIERWSQPLETQRCLENSSTTCHLKKYCELTYVDKVAVEGGSLERAGSPSLANGPKSRGASRT